MGSKVLRGVALHRGGAAQVTLSRVQGPITVAMGAATAALAELSPTRTDRGVTVSTPDGRVRVDLVEHLLAAIGALGVARDLRIEVDENAPEIPLLDGGCARFVDALAALDLPRERRLRVLRSATFEHVDSRYRFGVGDSCHVRVEVSFPPPVDRQAAEWRGDAADFRERIAPARTFGWAHEAEALRAAGRAAAVDLESVLVLDDRGPIHGCRAAGADEPARHKLLDLVGDLALYGGPPIGVVEAFAPGHTATHAVIARAIRERVVGRDHAE